MHTLLKQCIAMSGIFLTLSVNAQVLSPLPEMKHRFIVVAHRGDHTQAPENTLAGFANAIKEGVDYIEIDLRTTVDSQLVIMHDGSVDRMTDGKGQVKDMTYRAIRELKITDKAHPEWGTFQVPSFKEVLALSKGKIHIYLDFKNADPAAAYKEIVAAGMEKEVVVYINAEPQIAKWRLAAPRMPLMVSLPDTVRDTTSLKNFVSKFQVEILDGNYYQYTEDMITLAGKMGYWVLPDIESPKENPALWDQPIKKGIRALQTDHPVDLINYLQTLGLR